MSSVPLSSEAREFLRDVDREARRREYIAAQALTNRRCFRWGDAIAELEEIMADRHCSPIRRADRVRAKLLPLVDVAEVDRGFVILPTKSGRRTLSVNLLSVCFDEHPLEHVHGQRSLTTNVTRV